MTDFYAKDKAALRAMIEKMFADLSWDEQGAPEWAAFQAAFRTDAVLYPSARPASQTGVAAFVERMEGQRQSGAIRSLVEKPLDFIITVFGNTALIHVPYGMALNGGALSRGANMFLAVKDDGRWQVGAMAWDNESAAAPFPVALPERGSQ